MGKIMIDGIIITPLKKITHPRGDLFHIIKKSSAGYIDFGEAYISTIIKNEIKGWKKHHSMTLNLVVPAGEIRIVIFDGRNYSATKGKFQEIVLSKENYLRLTIPPQLWVAFQGVSDNTNMLFNIADIEHDRRETSNLEITEITYSWS